MIHIFQRFHNGAARILTQITVTHYFSGTVKEKTMPKNSFALNLRVFENSRKWEKREKNLKDKKL